MNDSSGVVAFIEMGTPRLYYAVALVELRMVTVSASIPLNLDFGM